MATYAVKELFRTLQGEGANTGRVAVFCRFTGCNLWSGREKDRAKGPGGCSAWCDTDFVGTDGDGGGKFQSAAALAAALAVPDHAFAGSAAAARRQDVGLTVLREAMSDTDPKVRLVALRYLVVTYPEPALDGMLKAAREDSDPQVRAVAFQIDKR